MIVCDRRRDELAGIVRLELGASASNPTHSTSPPSRAMISTQIQIRFSIALLESDQQCQI
jgi:hypothetical protein